MQAIKYKNVGLQGEVHVKDQKIEKCGSVINHLRKHYVDYPKNPDQDNVVMIVCKDTFTDNDEHF